MTFKGRLIADITDNSDGTNNYATSTNSIITFESTITRMQVQFKGFITEMSDNFQSSWETEEVYGRMDPIGTFKSTKRVITLGWTIPAASIVEAKSNFNAIKTLTSMLYPGYSAGQVEVNGESFTTTNSISKPPLIRLSYANLIQAANGEGLLGWVDGFNVQPNLEMGFFIENKNQFPKVYTMSCNFNVLHEHDLGWSTSTKIVLDDLGETEVTSVRWIGTNADKFPFGEE